MTHTPPHTQQQQPNQWVARLLHVAVAGTVGIALISVLFVAALLSLVLGYTTAGLVLLGILALAVLTFGILTIRQMRRSWQQSRLQLRKLQGELGLDEFSLRKRQAKAKLGFLWNDQAALSSEERQALRSCLAATEEAINSLSAPTAENSRNIYLAFRAAEEDIPLALELRQQAGQQHDLFTQLGNIEQQMHSISTQHYLRQQQLYRTRQEMLDMTYALDADTLDAEAIPAKQQPRRQPPTNKLG